MSQTDEEKRRKRCEYNRRWRMANPEKQKALIEKYQKSPKGLAAAKKGRERYRKKNAESLRLYNLLRHLAFPEYAENRKIRRKTCAEVRAKSLASVADYYRKNKEKIRKYKAEWYQQNKATRNAKNNAYKKAVRISARIDRIYNTD